MACRVMIVEDQAMPRQLFEMFVASSDRYELAVSIDNAAFADIYCLKHRIDLILMDVVTRNGESGLKAAARIKRMFPDIRIIIVTSMPEYSYIKQAREAGVESFWYKEISAEPIIEIMDRTMAGESIYPDNTPEIQMGEVSSYELSERELEVLREMTGGYTNQEIADKFFISTATVKSHIMSMLNKTGFRNRTELAVRARETGLVILEKEEEEN